MTATRRAIPGLPVVVLLLGAAATVPFAVSAAGQAAKLTDDIPWLEERSMLRQAREAAATVSGNPVQWRHPYGSPQPREAVRHASVWLLDYPGSVIPAKGQSVIGTWADPALWDQLRDLHIDLLHTGPLERGGGVKGAAFTPTTDGWFDRISLDLDPAFGTEAEYARLVAIAAAPSQPSPAAGGGPGGGVAGDLVPLHTGLGPDFHLALRGYKDYPGMYTLIEIPKVDWSLLPDVKGPWDTTLVPRPAAEQLTRKGYIPGLINSNDAAPEAKSWSGWSASGEVTGADGKQRCEPF
jgi:maltose alpha-D-glucosyltransferase/alpha-amylase